MVLMKIQEVMQQVQLSKRAIKFYEEKGLLKVQKDENGYRNYTNENIVTLEKISIYRKLGVEIKAIEKIFNGTMEEKEVLQQVYLQKQMSLQETKEQLQAIQEILQKDANYHSINQQLDYQYIADSIQEMIPGIFGKIYMYHFLPYLQIPFETEEQKQAYVKIIEFFDQVDLKVTIFQRISSFFQRKYGEKNIEKLTQMVDDNIQKMLHPTTKQYQQMKEMMIKSYKIQNNFLYKYGFFGYFARKQRRMLQECGYHDIFLPNMEKLCPKYKVYRQALLAINERLCQDLGMYYNEHYQLCKKNKGIKRH